MSRKQIFIDIPQIPFEEQEKYAGKHVAIVDGKIVAAGDSPTEVAKRAQELYPDRSTEEILLDYIRVPKEKYLIL